MIEAVLLIVILILCGLLGWKEREGRLERSKLINAILAKNAQDMVNDPEVGVGTQCKR